MRTRWSWSWLAAVLALAGCTRMSPPTLPRATISDTARAQFARDAYCPESRVRAIPIVPMALPPGPVAQDPERLAMWRRDAELRAYTEARKQVDVSGCGERARYACWVDDSAAACLREP